MAETARYHFDAGADQASAVVQRIVPTSMRRAREQHQLRQRRRESVHQASSAAQGSKGKLTASERIALLTDDGSFEEWWADRRSVGGADHSGDGVVTGSARIHGAQILVFSQDFTVRGGSLGQHHADKIVRLLQLAEQNHLPVVGLYDGGGARIDEGAAALHGCGRIFQQIVRLSGVVPQISAVLGPCAGAAAYAPALTDAVFTVRDIGTMYLTGPDVVRQVTGERCDGQSLGGADVHAAQSGVVTFAYDDEASCLADVRYLVSLLPREPHAPPPEADTGDPVDRDLTPLLDIVPVEPKLPYDVRGVVELLLDHETFLEFHQDWATNIVCGLGRLDGMVVGVVASQPAVRAGVLDSPASQKAARFVTWCDAFRIPLLTLVDVPGFMPGVDVERGGVIRHGAQLLHAYCAATVPRIQVLLRKAYGGAYIVMDSPSIGNDLSYAWPTNEVSVMGAEGAVEVLHRRELAESSDPASAREQLRQSFRAEQMHPYAAAHAGLVHEVIDPSMTRVRLASGLRTLERKVVAQPSRKHANAPL